MDGLTDKSSLEKLRCLLAGGAKEYVTASNSTESMSCPKLHHDFKKYEHTKVWIVRQIEV